MSDLAPVVTTQKRVELEFIRALAIIAVVFIHSASVIANNLEYTNQLSWFVITYIDALLRWAVPLFIMVSGTLILHKSEPHASFFRKRLGRVGLPLLIWLPLYWLALAIFSPPLPPLSELIHTVIYKQPYVHLYFLFVMVQLTLLTPWLRSVVRSLSRRALTLLIILLLYIGFAYQPYTHNVFFVFIPYLGYYLYGFFAREMTYKSRRNKVAALATIALTALAMVFTQFAVRTGLWTIHGVENATQIVAYLSPPVILMSLLAFPLFKDPTVVSHVTRRINKKWIISLGECSFGIYLIHPILQLMQGKLIPGLYEIQTGNPIPVTFALSFGLFVLSWGLAWFIKRVIRLSWII